MGSEHSKARKNVRKTALEEEYKHGKSHPTKSSQESSAPEDKEIPRANTTLSTSSTLVSPLPPPAPKPLSELYLIANGVMKMGGVLHSGKDIAFHDYKKEPALFNIETRFTAGQTHLTLRSGPTKKLATIGVYAFEESEGCRLHLPALGKTTFEKVGQKQYSWDLSETKLGKEEDLKERELKMAWQKHNLDNKVKGTFASPDWKLKDAKTGEVHAVLLWMFHQGTDRGQLQFRRSLGEAWEMGVLLTAAAIVEAERQRKAATENGTQVYMSFR